MKTHTEVYKQRISGINEIDSKINYIIDGVAHTLTSEELNSVTPNFQSAILKSAMKCLEIDSNIDIPLGTILNYKFGVKVGNEYEYLDYGNYIVYSSERQEDTESYKLICYDKMLYSMKNYDDVFEKNEVTYPITLRNFINLIATKMGIGFKDINTNFANYDKQISKELFYGLGYTLRDILDQCAEATASTICISDDDKLEIRYINDLNEVNSITGTNLIINDAFDYPVKKLTFDGRSTQETNEVSPSPDYPIEIESIEGIVQYKQVGDNIFNKNNVSYTLKAKKDVLDTGVRATVSVAGDYKYVAIKLGGSELLGKKITIQTKITPSANNEGQLSLFYGTSTSLSSKYRIVDVNTTNPTNAYILNTFPDNFDTIWCCFYGNLTGIGNVGDYVDYTDVMIVMGDSIADGYKPYQETILNINLQGNKLCSLSNGVKDELVVENGRAKIIKNVQEDLLDGVNKKFTSIDMRGTKTFLICNYSNPNIKKATSENEVIPLSNKFRSASLYDTWNGVVIYGISQAHNGHYLQLSFPKTISADLTLAGLNTWLASNNTKVQYQLETPIEIDLGEVTQPKTFEGVNNISNSEDTNMSVEYTNNWETIDEEFFKDVNVNFGEDYGPVNSVVLSRAETDNVYLQDEDSIGKNGLCEIKITDNQIMNWEDRSTYLSDILKKLDGLKYYLNDFSTFGITYLELCDKYNIKIRDNNYLCIFFNHELEITQGVEEKVYTEMPEQTETDYTKADKVERQIKNTSIIVDKQKQEIALKLDKGEFTHAQIVAKINDNTSQAQIKADQISLAGKEINLTSDNITINSNNFKVDKDGKIAATAGEIGGYNITNEKLFAEIYAPHDYTLEDAETARKIASGVITPTAEQIAYYDIDGDGVVTFEDYYRIRIYYEYHITTTNSAKFILQTGDFVDSAISLLDGNNIPVASLGFKGLILEGSISYHTTKSTDIFGKASFCRTLYDNPEGTNQTITLEYDEQFTSLFYNELEIIYGHEDYGYSSCKIPISSSLESYKVNLSASVWLSNIFYQTSSLLTLSGNKATFSNSVKVTNGSRENRTTSILKVYRIVGYFE